MVDHSRNSLSVRAIHTPIYRVGDSFENWLKLALSEVKMTENVIIAITSKVISLSENRCVPRSGTVKLDLIRKDASRVLGELDYGSHLTITHGILIAAAGIDESNSADEQFILYPKDPFASAEKICAFLKKEFGLKNVGVILTDSRTSPLRKGVTGIALSHWGFQGCKNAIGQKDLFGRSLKMTQINVADALAASAVLLMGEGNERCPIALIETPNVNFCDVTDPRELLVPLHEDLYRPFLDR